MSDGGSRGSTQLSISLVRPCPDGYTNSKYARRATDAESARVGWTQMKGGAKRGDRPI